MPNIEIGNNVTLRRADVDKRCRPPDGLKADIDTVADAERFSVTDHGVAVIVPECPDQRVHRLR